MIITRATEYSIRAILYMACQPQGEIIFKKDICRAQEITPAFLTKILQPLIKAGIVASQRGVGGGFFLARPAAEITLFDVIKTQEGPVYLNQCLMSEGSCARSSSARCMVPGKRSAGSSWRPSPATISRPLPPARRPCRSRRPPPHGAGRNRKAKDKKHPGDQEGKSSRVKREAASGLP